MVVRNSKWNAENWTKGRFSTNIDPECLTLFDVFRRGKKLSSKFLIKPEYIYIYIYIYI